MFSSLKNKPFLKKAVFFKKAAILTLALFLSAGLLFTSCSSNEDSVNTGFIPSGNWTDAYGGGYKISNPSFEYYTADSEWEGVKYPGESIKGSIKEAVDFSQNAGVLIVQITKSSTDGQAGKFIGVYYKDYTTSHVFLANAIDASYALILKNTLDEAKSTFNAGNAGTHVSMWGSGYNK
jgi:hypothetical protein